MIGVLEAERIMILESQVKHYERTVALMRQTLRDEFAMRALPISYQFWMHDFYHKDIGGADSLRDGFTENMSLIADCAYEMADAMMEARNES